VHGQQVDPETGHFASNTVSLGARGDSYYEYLLKQWLLSGKTDDGLLRCVAICCVPNPHISISYNVNILHGFGCSASQLEGNCLRASHIWTPSMVHSFASKLAAACLLQNCLPKTQPSVRAARQPGSCYTSGDPKALSSPVEYIFDPNFETHFDTCTSVTASRMSPTPAVPGSRRRQTPTIPASAEQLQARPSPQLWPSFYSKYLTWTLNPIP